jgi:hypothetical protein
VSVSLVPLLVREADVPAAARAQLWAALWADPDTRTSRLEAAAMLIVGALDLDPDEARALVGLPENQTSYIHVNQDRKGATP